MTNTPEMREDTFGPVQMVGCAGMLVCVAAALLLLVAAGGYTLSTGDALQVPIKELGLGWFGALAVFEVMAFGWVVLRLLLFSVCLSGMVLILVAVTR